jgi:hypothetical protein
MGVIHHRGGAEEAFLSQFALESTLGQVAMGLAGRAAFDAGQGDEPAHATSPTLGLQF